MWDSYDHRLKDPKLADKVFFTDNIWLEIETDPSKKNVMQKVFKLGY